MSILENETFQFFAGMGIGWAIAGFLAILAGLAGWLLTDKDGSKRVLADVAFWWGTCFAAGGSFIQMVTFLIAFRSVGS